MAVRPCRLLSRAALPHRRWTTNSSPTSHEPGYVSPSIDDISGLTATNFTVAAEIVILAAGTLGSTEILLRSARNGLKLSNQVGNHFSANGDTIGFAYNTDHEVNGIGLGAVTPNGKPAVGPCSTVMMDARGGVEIGNGMVMEDGAVPGALASVLAPLLAAGAGVLGRSYRSEKLMSTH